MRPMAEPPFDPDAVPAEAVLSRGGSGLRLAWPDGETGALSAEALRLANDTEHGLAAGIFTRDSARALRMSRAVRAGIVWVNTYRATAALPRQRGAGHVLKTER